MKLGNSMRCILSLACAICMVAACAGTALARQPRWIHRSPRSAPVVRHKVVVAPTTAVKTSTDAWRPETITQKELTPGEIKRRNLKPEYGLIDFEVYPYKTKIYIDGSYKGYAGTLNKDMNSVKARKGLHEIEFKKKNTPTKFLYVKVKAGHKAIVTQQ